MKSLSIGTMVIALLFGFAAIATDTTDGRVANIVGEHTQLVLVLCFGFFLICSFIGVAADTIIAALRPR